VRCLRRVVWDGGSRMAERHQGDPPGIYRMTEAGRTTRQHFLAVALLRDGLRIVHRDTTSVPPRTVPFATVVSCDTYDTDLRPGIGFHIGLGANKLQDICVAPNSAHMILTYLSTSAKHRQAPVPAWQDVARLAGDDGVMWHDPPPSREVSGGGRAPQLVPLTQMGLPMLLSQAIGTHNHDKPVEQWTPTTPFLALPSFGLNEDLLTRHPSVFQLLQALKTPADAHTAAGAYEQSVLRAYFPTVFRPYVGAGLLAPVFLADHEHSE
jgi:hypothetical protein